MKTWIALVGAVCVVAGGCANPVRPPIEGRMDPYAAPHVSLASEELRSDTAIGRPIEERDEQSGIKFVTVPIRPVIDRTIYVQWEATFLNNNGSPRERFQGTKVLRPNVPDQITFNSTSPGAADWRLTLMYPQVVE